MNRLYPRIRSWLDSNVRFLRESTRYRTRRIVRVADLEMSVYLPSGSSEWGLIVGFDGGLPILTLRLHKFRVELSWRDYPIDDGEG